MRQCIWVKPYPMNMNENHNENDTLKPNVLFTANRKEKKKNNSTEQTTAFFFFFTLRFLLSFRFVNWIVLNANFNEKLLLTCYM